MSTASIQLSKCIVNFCFCDLCFTVASERDIVLEVSETIKPELIADLMEWVSEA